MLEFVLALVLASENQALAIGPLTHKVTVRETIRCRIDSHVPRATCHVLRATCTASSSAFTGPYYCMHSQSLFKSDFPVALHMFVSVTLLTSRGPLLAIFSASSLLRLRSFDKSPTTGSNCNYNNKEFKKIYSDNDSHLPTFSQSWLRHFSKAK